MTASNLRLSAMRSASLCQRTFWEIQRFLTKRQFSRPTGPQYRDFSGDIVAIDGTLLRVSEKIS
jgi:hypothetical protein